MTRERRQLQVLVVGAGIAGLTTAYWLRRAGHHVRVIERAARPRAEGFMIDFYGTGYTVAEEMGIIPALRTIHREIARWTLEDMSGVPLFSLPYADVRRRLFGDRHFNFLRSHLERLLLSLVRDEIDVRYGVSLDALRPCGDCIAATLTDESSVVCDLVVGAGGMHSPTRRLWIGNDILTERYLGFDAAAFSFEDPTLRASVGDHVRTISGPGRQVTVYPTDDERIGVFLVYEREHSLEDRSARAILEVVRAVFREFGGVVPELLAAAGDATDVYYDAITQVSVAHWSRGHVVLVGDACHCVSPLGGQGASLAMAGARSLAQELATARNDVRVALTAYERHMRPIVARAQDAGLRMARWIAPRNKARMMARDLVLRASVWPVASSLMRHALGVTEGVVS